MAFTTAEFFAGMGLVRAALERCEVETVFANDIDETKADLYRDNWGGGEFRAGDIRALAGDDIPTVDLATASFPCVDLSLAGGRAGLDGDRSGLVFDFFRIIEEMGDRAPPTIMIENVPGLLTSNRGKDLRAMIDRMARLGYETAYECIDAAAFVPQSRVRVFMVGSRARVPSIPRPPAPRDDLRLADIARDDLEWWPPVRLGSFLSSLSPIQERRVSAYQTRADIGFFGAFRRTRRKATVWEVRADERAGALRTTRGGSSKQAILRAGQGGLGARWMAVEEYAQLQGAEGMRFGAVTPQQAMFALGDAVCVPAVEWLARQSLLPLMAE